MKRLKGKIKSAVSIILACSMIATSGIGAYADEPAGYDENGYETVLPGDTSGSEEANPEPAIINTDNEDSDQIDDANPTVTDDELSGDEPDDVSAQDEAEDAEPEIIPSFDTVPDVAYSGDWDHSYIDAEKNYVFDVSGCDFIVTVKNGSENDVFFNNSGQYSDLDNHPIAAPGYIGIRTCKPVKVTMREGVKTTAQRIFIWFSAHGADDCAHVTLKDVHIDRSAVKPFIQAVEEQWLYSDMGENGYGAFTALYYLGDQTDYTGCTLILEGDNTLIGPGGGDCNGPKTCYGIYARGGGGLGIKGTGSLKVRGEGADIKLDYGSLRIESGCYDVERVDCPSQKPAIITGGCYKQASILNDTIFDDYNGNGPTGVSDERYNPDLRHAYVVEPNEDAATKDEYPSECRLCDEAEAYLAPYLGRKILYSMSEDYGRAYDTVYFAGVEFTGGPTFTAKYHINNGFTMEETTMIQRAVENDHPEFIWWWNAEWGGWSRGVTMNLGNPLTSLELSQNRYAFKEAADKLLWEAGITDSMTDFQKSYALYQVLIANTVYDLSKGDQSAFEALTNGRGVCAGYAKAYVYLLQRAGIEASYVPGQAIPPGAARSDGHAWVILKINGNYYYSDPTWDDGGTTSRYTYFNIPWSKLSGTHFIDDDLGYSFPAATSPQLTAPTSTVSVRATASAGGSAYPKSLNLPSGSAVAITAVAKVNDGYSLDKITVNGAAVDPSRISNDGNGVYTLTLTEVSSAQNVSVSFKKETAEIKKYPVGDLVIYATNGGELDSLYENEYLYVESGNFLQITTSKPVTVEMAEGVTETDEWIQIGKPGDQYVTLTIKDLNIKHPSHDTNGIIYASGTGLNLILSGTNRIEGDLTSTENGISGIYAGRGWSFSGSDGPLTITGSGSLEISGVEYGIAFSGYEQKSGTVTIHDCHNGMGGLESDYIKISGGKFGLKNNLNDFYDWHYNYSGNSFPAITITGGMFSSGNISAKTVLGLPISYPGTSSCKVVSSGNADFPFKVQGSGAATVKVTSLTVTPATATLFTDDPDESLTLSATYKPDNASDPALTWTSSDASIATVTDNNDGTATVIPVSAGTVNITVKAGDGSGKSAVCAVTVKAQPVAVITELGEIKRFSSLKKAHDYIVTALSEDDTALFTVRLEDDAELTGDELDFGGYYTNITLDTNGHFLVVSTEGTSTTPADSYIAVATMTSAYIAQASYSCVHIASRTVCALEGFSFNFLYAMGMDDNTRGASIVFPGNTAYLQKGGLNAVSGVSAVFGENAVFTAPASSFPMTYVDDLTVDASGILLQMLCVNNTLTVTEGASLNTPMIMSSKGTIINAGTITTPNVSAYKFDNKPGAKLYTELYMADRLTGTALYLEPGSTLRLGGVSEGNSINAASIYNLVLGQDITGTSVVIADPGHEGEFLPAYLEIVESANISVNTSFTAADPTIDRLNIRTVSVEEPYPTIATKRDTPLITTDIKVFPVDLVTITQDAANSDYDILLQNGSDVSVVSDFIKLYADDKLIATFTRLGEAVNYINTISNPTADYTIKITSDVETRENLSFPSKAASFTLMGTDPDNPVRLEFTGNVAPTIDTTFKNIILDPVSYDKSGQKNANTAATLTLGAKTVRLENAYFAHEIASVNGQPASILILDSQGRRDKWGGKQNITVTNAFTVGNLDALGFKITSVNNALTVSNDAYLLSSDIDVKTNVSIKNLHTLDGYNAVSFASAANNTFTVSGTVDSTDRDGIDEDEEITVKTTSLKTVGGVATPETVSVKISNTAISLELKHIESTGQSYADFPARNIVSGAKAPAAFFVIGKDASDPNDVKAAWTLKKVDKNLRIATSVSGNVTLYAEDAGHEDIIKGNFETVKEAFDEIERFADKNASYIIKIDQSAGQSASYVNGKLANFATPKQARKVTVTTMGLTAGSKTNAYATLYMNNLLTVNSEVVFEKVVIDNNLITKNGTQTNTKLNINLNGNALSFKNVVIGELMLEPDPFDEFAFPEWYGLTRIGNITGGKTTSSLTVSFDETYDGMETDGTRYPFVVNGNITNLGMLTLKDAHFGCFGTTTIGNIFNTDSLLEGACKIATQDKTETIEGIKGKRKYVTAVNPSITVTGTIVNTSGSDELKLSLLDSSIDRHAFKADILEYLTEERAGYVEPTDAEALMNYASLELSGTFRILKAPNVSADAVSYYDITSDRDDAHLIRQGGFIVVSGTAAPYALSDDTGRLGRFASWTDVVVDINSRNNKDANYTVTTTGNSELVAESFAMPTAGKLASLKIMGIDGEGNPAQAVLNVGTVKNGAVTAAVTKLTLTSDTEIEGITFVNAYAATATPLTLAIGGKKLTLSAAEFAGRGLLIDGGKTGILELKGDDGLRAGVDRDDLVYNYIEGQIINLKELILTLGTNLEMTDYVSAVNNKGEATYKPAALNVTDLNLNANEVSVCGPMGGQVNITNLTTGSKGGTSESEIRADRELNIKGTLTAKESVSLVGRLKTAKAGTPIANVDSYINISGVTEVTYGNTIAVKMYPYEIPEDRESEEPVKLPAGSMMRLVTAPKASLEDFYTGNESVSGDELSCIKLGNIVYATDFSAVGVAVFKGDGDYFVDTDLSAYKITDRAHGSFEWTVPYGYYPAITDAIAAISAAPGKEYYSVVLLKDMTEPVNLTFPKTAAVSGLTIEANSIDEYDCDPMVLSYKNNLTLTSDLKLRDIILAPAKSPVVNKVQTTVGAGYNMNIGNFTLDIDNREPGSDLVGYYEEGGNITSQILNLTSGKTGSLRISNTVAVISGNLNVASLILENDAEIDIIGGAKVTATVGDIKCDDGSGIIVNRGALTITGRNTGTDSITVSINTGFEKEGFDCLHKASDRLKNGAFNPAKKLLTAAYLGAREIYFEEISDFAGGTGSALTDVGTDGYVKIGNDFYYVSPELSVNMVRLDIMDGDTADTAYYCLDYNSAITQINTWNDASRDYRIVAQDSITDTCITDNIAHSAITMPAANKARSLTIASVSGGRFLFSGNITAYGEKLKFYRIKLEPVTAANDKNGEPVASNANISLARNTSDKTGNPLLSFIDASVGSGYGGHINNISGTPKATDVLFDDSDVKMTGTFINIRNITCEVSFVLAGGKGGSAERIIMDGLNPIFGSLGTFTSDEIVVNRATGTAELITVSNNTANTFTLKGGIIDEFGRPKPSDFEIEVTPLRPVSRNKNDKGKTEAVSIDNYYTLDFRYDHNDGELTGQNLINAPKAWAGYFALHEDSRDDYRNYKIGTGIYCDPVDEAPWDVAVSYHDTSSSAWGNGTNDDTYVTYAHTYAEAVAAINTYATKRDYTVTLQRLSDEDRFIHTGGKVAASVHKNGVVTYPVATPAALTFPTAANCSTLKFATGTGSSSGKSVFAFTGNIKPGVKTEFTNVVMTSGTVKAGTFAPSYTVNADMTTGYDLTFGPASCVLTEGGADNGMIFNTVTGTKGVLAVIDRDVTFTGDVNTGTLMMMHRDTNTNTVLTATQSNAAKKLNVAVFTSNGRARLVKASGDERTVAREIKLTGDDSISLIVRRGRDDGTDSFAMESETCVATWNDALAYINGIADKTAWYEIVLLKDLGGDGADGNAEPISKFTLPTSAAKVVITDNAAEDRAISINGTTLSIPCNTVFDDIAVHAYKATTVTINKVKTTKYDPVSYAITVAGNNTLTLAGDGTGEEYKGISQITGANLVIKGLDGAEGRVNVEKAVTVKSLSLDDAKLIVSAGNLTASVSAKADGSKLMVGGNATIKDAVLNNAVIKANNIVLNGNTVMAGSVLDAGYSAIVGNGKITIRNMALRDADDEAAVPYNEIIVKQDKAGTSMLAITGTVTDEREDKSPVDVDGDDIGETAAAVLIRVLYNNVTTTMTRSGRKVQTNVVPFTGMVYVTFATPVRAAEYTSDQAGIFAGAYTDVTGTLATAPILIAPASAKLKTAVANNP